MEVKKKQSLNIDSREIFSCDLVRDVEEFSGEYVVINTDFGKLALEGEGLRIKELNEKEGKISVIGKIIGASFFEENEHRGFFKRKK